MQHTTFSLGKVASEEKDYATTIEKVKKIQIDYNTSIMSVESEYRIEYEIDKKSNVVTATIPELNHTSSFGSSFAEAEANVREAALGYLEVLVKEHKDIPKSAFNTEGTYIKLFIPEPA